MNIGLQSQIYEFEEFRLDAAKRLLLRGDDEVIPLTPKIFDTLFYLVRNSKKVIQKDELMREIWTDTIVEENNLNKNISVLRRVLGEKPGEQRYIVTVAGQGYKFVAEVRENPANRELAGGPDTADPDIFQASVSLTDDESQSARQIAKNKSRTTENKRESRFWFFCIIIAAVAGLSFFGFYSWRDDKPSDAPITSIAVLPFVNVGGDPEMEYLSDGISESLIDRLSELPQLKVIARNSSFKYRGENIDLQDAAAKLGVQAIITGRAVRRDDNLLIRVELVDVRDNKQLWGAEFNRKAEVALSTQQEIALAVSEKLRLKLSGAQTQQIAAQTAVNAQAYELLLKGRFLQIRRETESVRKAIEYYRQAIEIAPNYALAYALLSDSYWWLVGQGVLDPKEFTPKAQTAAQKALELDPNLAEAHLAMANFYLNDWNWAAAETKYKRAIELNPNFVLARNNYCAYLSITGRYDEAIAEARRAKELDPLTISTHLTVAFTLTIARRYVEAIAEFKKILDVDKNNIQAHGWLMLAYSGKGMYREALASCQEAIRLGDERAQRQIYLGAVYANMGEREKASGILKQLESSKEYVSPGELAVLYTSLGEREKAIASLEKAYAAHDLQLQYLKVEPAFDALRFDPRFQDLMRRVGFQE